MNTLEAQSKYREFSRVFGRGLSSNQLTNLTYSFPVGPLSRSGEMTYGQIIVERKTVLLSEMLSAAGPRGARTTTPAAQFGHAQQRAVSERSAYR